MYITLYHIFLILDIDACLFSPCLQSEKKIIISLSVSSRTVGILKRYKVKTRGSTRKASICKQKPTTLKEKIQIKQV